MAKKQPKYYTVKNAIKMLPLIKSYCRDLVKANKDYVNLVLLGEKLENLTSTNQKEKDKIIWKKEEVKERLKTMIIKIVRWNKEIKDLNLEICNVALGRINIYVYDDNINSIINLCINASTTEKEIEWHEIEESHENSRPFLGIMLDDKDLEVDLSGK